ncbi:MAG TPA: nucleotidyltransferase domain-containing protein [Spirochaetota bacterium]|nr:nucleotidyltransferase domain-containing protein [Spirochaetota bacterium]
MNNRFGITEKSYNCIVTYLKSQPQIETVIIFGSRAKGNYKKGSDIDLAIKGEKCSPMLAIDIESFINEEIPVPYTVDVVDYNSLKKKELKNHIDRVGILFYPN